RKNGSQNVTALMGDPPHQYTGIFLANISLLSIHSSPELECWMKSVNDSTPISTLSIPGTHNSPACLRALPSIRCQAVSLREQLENGIRFLDVRVEAENPEKDGLILVHDGFPISLIG